MTFYQRFANVRKYGLFKLTRRNIIMAQRKLPRFLTPLEVAEMFKVSGEKPRDCMLMKCLYFLGLRNSEAQKLNIDDIDLINKTVKVVQGKGEKDRYVPIPGDFSEELKAFVGDRKGLLFTGRGPGGGGG